MFFRFIIRVSILIGFVISVGLGLPACITQQVKVAGLDCPCKLFTKTKDPDNQAFTGCELNKPLKIEQIEGDASIILPRHTYVFFKDQDKLTNCEIYAPTPIFGTELTEGSKLFFGDNRQIIRIENANPITVNGFDIPPGAKVDLYDNGNLKEIQSSGMLRWKDMEVDGSQGLRFYPNNVVQSCIISKPALIEGYQWKAGYAMEFYESGVPTKGYLAESCTINELPIADSWVMFWDTGILKHATLSRDTETSQGIIPASSKVVINPEGLVIFIDLASSHSYSDISCQKGWIELYESQSLKYCQLSQPTVFDDYYHCEPGYASFFEDGTLRGCRLSRPIEIRGTTVRQGAIVQLEEDGGLYAYDLDGRGMGSVDRYLIDGTFPNTSYLKELPEKY